MRRIVVSRRAEDDLADITDYISQDNPELALSFALELQGKFTQISERPMSFPLRAEWGSDKRAALHGRYLIIFKVFDELVEILRIAHGARDIDEMFL